MFCLFLASAPFPHWHLDIWMFKLFLQNFICFANRLLFDIYQEGEKKKIIICITQTQNMIMINIQ